ncbi:hypothetical protein J8273_7779 [Carpediemonas membranifera]|uniref:Uncharacterized protein n=1 Tax=Carpediemonas membranifera TaxID=201153 RepID=A0A8J6DXM0_9EUKA|nr:hypothetical protein J8273_7779 [Carpediemonas membranifera]|eukprot:KAG9390429.1 hypothetical protein J8273_7779 [Carpediemonas membranifera]
MVVSGCSRLGQSLDSMLHYLMGAQEGEDGHPQFIKRIDALEDVALQIAEPPQLCVRELVALSAMRSGKPPIPSTIRVDDKDVDISVLLKAMVPPDLLASELQWSAENPLPTDQELAGMLSREKAGVGV